MKFLYSTALTLVASIALAGAEPEGQLRKLVLTKPPIDTRCPLTNQMLFPTQQAFRQNEGGFMKLKITNPLDVAIPGPIVVNYRFPNGTRGPPDFRATGGYFAYPLGSTEITNRYARRAKSSWGVRPAEISADRRSVVFTLAGISARKSVNLVVLIDIGAGTQRSTNIIANATYTFEGTACLSRSNQLALSPYITPVATLDTTSNGQRVIYQQYASAYRICRSNIGVFNFTTPQNCAAECNKNSDCQGFVMAAPTNTDFGNRTCKLYDGNPGSSKTLNYGDAQGNSTTGRLGETIYLQSRNPDRYIISANPCTFT